MTVDPVHEVGSLGVDPRVVGLRTPVAPGHHTGQLGSAHEGTAGVTLERVRDETFSYDFLKSLFYNKISIQIKH